MSNRRKLKMTAEQLARLDADWRRAAAIERLALGDIPDPEPADDSDD